MNPIQNLIAESRIDGNETRDKQRLIFEEVLFQSNTVREPGFRQIETADLQLLFDLYDYHFFRGEIRNQLLEAGIPLAMRLSKRMTSAGGKTTMTHPYGQRSNRGKSFEIALSTTLLFESFEQGTESMVVGLSCRNRLEGLQRIFEHELIHLVEMMVWVHSSCAQRRFRAIAHQLFGHLESNHQLTTPRETAARKLGIRMGDEVAFESAGQTVEGFVNRITRRATVLVRDRRGELFDDGLRYRKYYVPLDQLRRAV